MAIDAQANGFFAMGINTIVFKESFWELSVLFR